MILTIVKKESLVRYITFNGLNIQEISDFVDMPLVLHLKTVFRPSGNIPQDYYTIHDSQVVNYGDYIVEEPTGYVVLTKSQFETIYY